MNFVSICKGTLTSIENVPDVVFSDKIMGDGIAFLPDNGRIVSPVSGVVKYLYQTGHAIVIETEEKHDVLIHFGLKTFTIPEGIIQNYGEIGMMINAGDLLMTINLNYFHERGINTITPVVFTNGAHVNPHFEMRNVEEGEALVGLID